MAKLKLAVSLSPIAAQIDKAEKKLKSFRPSVSAASQKAIDLDIKKLKKVRAQVASLCHKMTHAIQP